MKYFEPEETFSKADFPRKSEKKEGESKKIAETKISEVKPSTAGPADPSGRMGPALWAPGKVIRKADLPAKPLGSSLSTDVLVMDRLLMKAALENREKAVYALRHWYWEKPSASTETWRSVPGHDRILIILASIGEKITNALLAIMTPVEQGQLREILRRQTHFSSDQVGAVRKKFMEMISESK